MTTDTASHLSAEDLLQAFAVDTLAVSHAVTALVQAERNLVGRAQTGAEQSAREFDRTDLALQLAGPRLAELVRMHERLGRTLRLTVALQQRIRTGWPRRGEADGRRAMVRRQVERRLRDDLADAPERLLRAMQERLWDPGLEEMLETMPVDEIVAELGRELAAVRAEMAATGPRPDATVMQPHPAPGQWRGVPDDEEEALPEPRPWPAGMVNPPPHDYEPWRPEQARFGAYHRRKRDGPGVTG